MTRISLDLWLLSLFDSVPFERFLCVLDFFLLCPIVRAAKINDVYDILLLFSASNHFCMVYEIGSPLADLLEDESVDLTLFVPGDDIWVEEYGFEMFVGFEKERGLGIGSCGDQVLNEWYVAGNFFASSAIQLTFLTHNTVRPTICATIWCVSSSQEASFFAQKLSLRFLRPLKTEPNSALPSLCWEPFPIPNSVGNVTVF